MEQREKLGTRIGFIFLSAGCAIGCGNVWKFPWMAGENGGGAFVLIYLVFLVILGLPVMTMEFSLGRASQASPVRLYQKLEKPGQKWHIHGYASLAGNIILMMFYTVVSGWMIYYCYRFLFGTAQTLTFESMLSSPQANVIPTLAVVIGCFAIIAVGLQKGVERITKYLMIALLVLMLGLAVYSMTLPNAAEGLKFYLVPDFSKITPSVVVGAMDQAFFTLSVGMGSMAMFGSYINKNRRLLGETIHVVTLDTFVAIMCGLIIFPSCFANGYTAENFGGSAVKQVSAGPGLLFETMSGSFNNMGTAGRWLGFVFFMFMTFAAISTVIAVFETILACVKELTGFTRVKTSIICCIGMAVLSLPCALGFNLLSGIHPLGGDSSFLDLEDFLVSNCILPLGSLVYVLFCTSRLGWGWQNFKHEANLGQGAKIKEWTRPYTTYVLPVIILAIFVVGMVKYFS